MSNLVIAAPVTLIAFPFSADWRRPWWRRLIRSLALLQFFPFDRILVDSGCSPRGPH
jgi:hypothetical protein